MKALILKKSSTVLALLIATAGLCMLLIFSASCRKNNAARTSPETLNYLSSNLEGMLLTGNLTTEKDSDGLAIFCNNGKTLIAVGSLAPAAPADPGNMEHAAVIYSRFGVIVRNLDTGQVWYYIQNDEQSRQRFQTLQGAVANPLISPVTETIKINIS
jgi:hypothetical protein